MRPAVKTCVWLGSPDAYRNQDAVLKPLAESSRRHLENGRGSDDTLRYSPSGLSIRWGRALRTAAERGGSTPFNLIQLPNTNGAAVTVQARPPSCAIGGFAISRGQGT